MVAGIALFCAAPAMACSGPGPRGHAIDADVIVSGRIVHDENADADVIVTKTVLKGTTAPQYKVDWVWMSVDDECAFLSPTFRDRGVYFLKLLPEGEYLVIWTEKRWDTRWGKDL